VTAAYDAIVIGGGHNGLVAAAYVARNRRRVLVVERADEVGGIGRTVELAPGFRGPALLHSVGGLRRSVIRDLGLERHGLRLLRPAVPAFGLDPEGGGVALHREPGRTADRLRARSPADAEAFPRFDRRVRAVASFLAYVAAATPPDIEHPSLADALSGLRLGRAFRRLGRRPAREVLRVLPMPAADLVGDMLTDDVLRAVVAARGSALTGMGPWTPGTAAVLLMRSVAGGGAAGQTEYAEGGPGALATALEAAARGFGAEVRTGAEVTAVTSSDRRATGVVLASGEEIEGRAVVSTVDPKRTLSLVDPMAAGPTLLWRGRNLRAPGAVAKVNLALDELPAFVGVDDLALLSGRVVVAPSVADLERAADDHKYGRVSEAPFLEVTIPSLTDPTLTPERSHVMSVLFHSAPYRLRDGEWDESAGERIGDLALKTLETYAPGLSDRVVARQVLTPRDLEDRFALTEGCVLHAEPGLDQFFAWRPMLGHARYRFGLPGLYLAGSGAHPGGEITGAPGANAAREILADLRRQPPGARG
jgi:phytoene dehydrogenase-like protein